MKTLSSLMCLYRSVDDFETHLMIVCIWHCYQNTCEFFNKFSFMHYNTIIKITDFMTGRNGLANDSGHVNL